MKYAEAKRLDAEGTLKRRVLTEQGWYLPGTKPKAVIPAPLLPAVFRRKPGRPRKIA